MTKWYSIAEYHQSYLFGTIIQKQFTRLLNYFTFHRKSAEYGSCLSLKYFIWGSLSWQLLSFLSRISLHDLRLLKELENDLHRRLHKQTKSVKNNFTKYLFSFSNILYNNIKAYQNTFWNIIYKDYHRRSKNYKIFSFVTTYRQCGWIIVSFFTWNNCYLYCMFRNVITQMMYLNEGW